MNLISRIPKDFYKVFGSKYMEFYMQFPCGGLRGESDTVVFAFGVD
ncbi:MAG: hypothetical protein ACLU80_11230 [Dorea sp.]